MSEPSVTAELHRVFENAADVYDQSGVEFFRPIGRRLIELAGISAGESVLDVACGRGAVLLPAAEAVGASGRAVGIDMAESMLGHTARAAEHSRLHHVETHVMDGRRPDFPAGTFDVVTSSCGAIIWITGVEDLRPYRQLLRPGGRLTLSAPSFFQAEDNSFPMFPDSVYDLLAPEMTRILHSGTFEHAENNPFVNPTSAWLANRERVHASLIEAGFTGTDIREENLPITVESGQQWVEWTNTHGMRAMWQQLPAPRAEELATEVATRLDALRDTDGLIRLENPIIYIRGNLAES